MDRLKKQKEENNKIINGIDKEESCNVNNQINNNKINKDDINEIRIDNNDENNNNNKNNKKKHKYNLYDYIKK